MTHNHFHHLAFRAIFSSFRISEPFLSLVLGIQSHSSLLVSGIQSHYLSIVWLSEPSSYVFNLAFRAMSSVLGVQSHVFNLAFRALCILIQAFRVIIFLHFGAQSNFSLALSFRVIAPTFIFTGIAHITFTILHSSSFSSPRYLMLIACSSCFSRASHPP